MPQPYVKENLGAPEHDWPPAPVAIPAQPRRAFGIPELDVLLGSGESGISRGSTWLVVGAPGAGKTLLATHFLAEGLRLNEPGLYITIADTPARIVQSYTRQWPELEQAIQANRLAVLDPSPFFTEIRMHQQDRGRIWNDIWRFVLDVVKQSRNQGARRIVIDPLTPLLLAHQNLLELWDTTQTLLTAFSQNLGATTLITHCTMSDPRVIAVGETLEHLCTGVLQLSRAPRSADLCIDLTKHRYAAGGVHTINCMVTEAGRIAVAANRNRRLRAS